MIRLAAQKDKKNILAIYQDRSVRPYLNYDELSDVEFDAIFLEKMSDPFKLYVFEENDQILGTVTIQKGQHRNSHVAMICALGIKQNFQGKGFGKKYFMQMIDLLKDEGFLRVELMVEEDNENAIEFYKKLGFEVEGILKKYFKRNRQNHYVNELYMGLLFE